MRATRAFLLFTAVAIAACSNDGKIAEKKEPHPMCQSHVENAAIKIDGIFVFGSLQHGAVALDTFCPDRVMRLHVAKVQPGVSPDDLLQKFRYAFFFSPKIKSGVFKISGVGKVNQNKKEILIQGITEFSEVEASERDRIFALMQAEGRQQP